MNTLFAKWAVLAWALLLRVVPLEPNTKRPAKELKGWQGYLASLPSPETRAKWLAEYASRGWGLLLGSEILPGYQIIGLDVDDDRLVAATRAFLQHDRQDASLVAKVGKKGQTVFARAKFSEGIKSAVIRGGEGIGNVDLLASGKMTVMPPSIHPETGEPYRWVGPSLLDVEFEKLPEVTDRQIKVLKAAFGSPHALALITGLDTHGPGVALVASLMRSGATDGEITALITGLLPDGYQGDSLGELPGWISSAREKNFGAPSEGTQNLTASVIAVATAACVELFNDGDGNAYASVAAGAGTFTYRIGGEPFRRWVRYQAHSALERPIGTGPLLEAIAGIEAMALFEGAANVVNNRVAGDAEGVEIDLGSSDGRVVSIDKDGWRIRDKARHKFIRGAGYGPLPEPQGGGRLSDLQEMLGLSWQNFLLVVAFIINALKPGGPFFILLVEGEQGSGKSFICEIIKKILDPNKAPRLRLPDNERELMIQAKEYRQLNFDNASGMKAEMSDALCALATGAGVAYRKLYTDGDLHVMSFARPFVINGISGYVSRPDLMERAIPLKLSALPESARKTEAELLATFEAILPGVLGILYDAVSGALSNFPSVVPPRHLRMADAARWIKAAEPALGLEGQLIEAISKAQDEFVLERIHENTLFVKLRAFVLGRAFEGLDQPFEGYVSELLAEIGEPTRGLPATASQLSRELKRLRPAMAKAGVEVEFFDRDRGGRRVRVTLNRSAGGAEFDRTE